MTGWALDQRIYILHSQSNLLQHHSHPTQAQHYAHRSIGISLSYLYIPRNLGCVMETGNGPTPIALPASLPYPITVSRISSPTSAQVNRGSPLFEYSFTSSSSLKALDRRNKGLPPQPGDKDAKEGDMVGTWDSELQGELTHWEDWIQPGTIIDRNQVG